MSQFVNFEMICLRGFTSPDIAFKHYWMHMILFVKMKEAYRETLILAMPEQLRINFFGAPSRGKSNLAADMYAELRYAHINAEYVQEWIKHWAYNGVKVQQFDQIYVFGKQHHLEYDLLKAGVKNVVTDSPIWLSVFYAPKELKQPLSDLIREYEKQYPALNLLILRDKDAPYEREGRYQDEAGAQELENKLKNFLPEALQGYSKFQTFYFSQQEEIKQAVLAAAIR